MPQSTGLPRKVVAASLTCANAGYLGFTSMSGVLLILPNLPLAMTAFFLASLIEADVNRINLNAGIKKMTLKDYLLLRLAHYRLLELLKEMDAQSQPDFLKNYAYYYHTYERLKHTAPSSEDLVTAAQQINDMERYFADAMLDPSKGSLLTTLMKTENPTSFQEDFYYKQRIIRLSWLVSLGAGIGTGFITAYTAHTGLNILLLCFSGATLTAGMSAAVIPIAIAAGIAYTIITYNNIHDIIVDESIRKNWHNTKDYFKRSAEGSLLQRLWHWTKKILFFLLITTVVACSIFMTIATAGTWWYGVKHGAALIPWLKKVAGCLLAMTVPCVALGAFLFNFNNSLKTIWEVEKRAFRNEIREKRERMKETWSRESWPERLNPFRLLKGLLILPVSTLLFIGHIISVGAITDRMPNVPAYIPMMVDASAEASEDLHFLMKKDPGVLTYFVAILLSPLTLLDAMWRYFAPKKPEQGTSEKSFRDHLSDAWGLKQLPKTQEALPKPTLSKEFEEGWKKQQLCFRLEETANRYHSSLDPIAAQKKAALHAAARYIKDTAGDLLETFKTVKPSLQKSLAQKRYGVFKTKGQTHGEKFLADLNADFFPTAVA